MAVVLFWDSEERKRRRGSGGAEAEERKQRRGCREEEAKERKLRRGSGGREERKGGGSGTEENHTSTLKVGS